ncbi:hypothetical protein KKE38_03735 [Candidatus Micrarchaeota archaeon]|nr:hypothetical protein [Candidatus Micrarchaeota archaeon]
MKRLQKPPVGKTKEKKQEPLAEGLQIVPRDSRGRRLWSKISDEEIVEVAQKFMREKRITGRGELSKDYSGLYQTLGKRDILDKVKFEERKRSWKSMKNEEIVEIAMKMMQEKEITGRNELQKADLGLYDVLRKRRLLDGIEFEEKRRKKRSWKSMKNEEIVELARKIIKERGITARHELQKADSGLYLILSKRGLLERIGVEEKKRSWGI